jgi:hypothetical protein
MAIASAAVSATVQAEVLESTRRHYRTNAGAGEAPWASDEREANES